MMLFIKLPYRKSLPRNRKAALEKLSCLYMADIKGVIISFTKDWTTELKAAPTTTATARSTTLPRKMNFLNSLNIGYTLTRY